MNITDVVQSKANPNIPPLAPGDTVKVHYKVVEGERERIQVFQGTIISVQDGATGNFTVRRVAFGSGVERTYPILSPLIEKVEVMRHGKVRRAKLYYLRGLTTKKSRIKERRDMKKPGEESALAPETEVAPETTQTQTQTPEA